MKSEPQKLECKPVGDITLHLTQEEANDLAVLVRLKQLDHIDMSTLNYPDGFQTHNIYETIVNLQAHLVPTYKK